MAGGPSTLASGSFQTENDSPEMGRLFSVFSHFSRSLGPANGVLEGCWEVLVLPGTFRSTTASRRSDHGDAT